MRRVEIMKTGIAWFRRLIVEGAWSQRHKPTFNYDMCKTLEELSPKVQEITSTRGIRLHQGKVMYLRPARSFRKQIQLAQAAASNGQAERRIRTS